MRPFYTILIFTTLIFAGSSVLRAETGNVDPVWQYLSENDQKEVLEKNREKIESFLRQYADREHNVYQLQKIFYRTHRKFLRNYTAHSDMQALIGKGDYDCVTGTLLFGYFLSTLGYDYEIRFSPYHVYMIVQTTEGEVLLESTDPMTGFVSGQEQIASRQAEIWKEMKGTGYSIHAVDNLEEAIGLLYYNRAVEKYNEGNYTEAFELTAKSAELLKTEMVLDLLDLTITHIISDELVQDMKVRDAYMTRYFNLLEGLQPRHALR